MAFEIPPWIRPADTATEYSRGLALGAQIAQQNQRLAAQQEQAAMEAAIRTQQIQREAELERTRVAVQEAYNQQRLDLERQQLDSYAAANNAKVMDAARQFAAQEEYRQRVAAGEDPATVGLELFPLLGLGAGDWGAAMRSRATPDEGPVQGQAVLGPNGEVLPGLIATPSASGAPVVRNIPGFRPEGIGPGEKNAMRVILEKRKKDIQDEMPPSKPRKSGPELDAWNQSLERIRQINEQINALYPGLTNMAAMTPPPRTNQTLTVTRSPSGKLELRR